MKRTPLTRKTPMKRGKIRFGDDWFKKTIVITQGVDVLPGRPEYKTKRWKEVERSTIEGRKARKPAILAVQVFRATEKKDQRKAAQNKSAKRSGLKRSSPVRAQQRREYNRRRPIFLWEHPYCQITIAYLGLNEADIIRNHGYYLKHGPKYPPKSCRVPDADQLHHRNKANGARLNNQDYWMAVLAAGHEWVEKHKDKARALGLLCPINCKPDGTMPDGTKQPTTTELLAQRAGQTP